MNDNLGVIDNFLNIFSTTASAGYGNVAGEVDFLFRVMVIISLAMTGIFMALGEGSSFAPTLLRKALLIGFFSYIISDWQHLTEVVNKSFATLGLEAGGNTMSLAQFASPGAIAQRGAQILAGINQQVDQLTGPVSTLVNINSISILIASEIGIIIAYIVLAAQVVVTMVEFKIVTLAAFVLLPFGVFSKTGFLAERALGFVASSGVKMMTLALVVSIGSIVMFRLTPGPVPNVNECLACLLGAITLFALAWQVPALASFLVTGGPSLGAGAAVGGALGVAGAVAAGAATAWGLRATRAAAGHEPPGHGPVSGAGGGGLPLTPPSSSPPLAANLDGAAMMARAGAVRTAGRLARHAVQPGRDDAGGMTVPVSGREG